MSIRRVVFDSNVIISAFLFGGPPARLLEHALNGSVVCFTSLAILDEVRDVLQRPKFGLTPDQALSLIEELHDLCQLVTPAQRVHMLTSDPDDNAILECAEAANADTIVSGDGHLLALMRWRGVQIISPANAMAEMNFATAKFIGVREKTPAAGHGIPFPARRPRLRGGG